MILSAAVPSLTVSGFSVNNPINGPEATKQIIVPASMIIPFRQRESPNIFFTLFVSPLRNYIPSEDAFPARYHLPADTEMSVIYNRFPALLHNFLRKRTRSDSGKKSARMEVQYSVSQELRPYITWHPDSCSISDIFC